MALIYSQPLVSGFVLSFLPFFVLSEPTRVRAGRAGHTVFRQIHAATADSRSVRLVQIVVIVWQCVQQLSVHQLLAQIQMRFQLFQAVHFTGGGSGKGGRINWRKLNLCFSIF